MKNVKGKGSAGERELAMWLFRNGLTALPPKRNLEQTRKGGIDLIPDNHPFAYEVKRVQNITIGTFDKWWIKARIDCKPLNREAVVAFRTNRSDWMFMVEVGKLLGVPGSYAIIRSVIFKSYAQKRIGGLG